jgi:hypothetical protein
MTWQDVTAIIVFLLFVYLVLRLLVLGRNTR